MIQTRMMRLAARCCSVARRPSCSRPSWSCATPRSNASSPNSFSRRMAAIMCAAIAPTQCQFAYLETPHIDSRRRPPARQRALQRPHRARPVRTAASAWAIPSTSPSPRRPCRATDAIALQGRQSVHRARIPTTSAASAPRWRKASRKDFKIEVRDQARQLLEQAARARSYTAGTGGFDLAKSASRPTRWCWWSSSVSS